MGAGLVNDLRYQLSNLGKFQIEMKHAHNNACSRTRQNRAADASVIRFDGVAQHATLFR